MIPKSWKLILNLLLTSPLTAAQSPTLRSNYSLTATTSPSATDTGSPCCVVVPMTVGLNFWWNQTLTATVATILTKYLQYNNTILTTTTTIYNATATNDVTVPSDIIPGTFIYSQTIIGPNTTADFANTAIASPTPFVAVAILAHLNGTATTDSAGQSSCQSTGPDGPATFYQLDTPWAYVEDPPVTRTEAGYANPPPTGIIDAWIAQTPTITQDLPDLKSCSIPSGSGEPSVHVPVTALTSHETTTIRMDGGGPAPAPSSTNEAAPTSKGEPSSTPASGPGPSSTRAPGPEPTSQPPAPTSNSPPKGTENPTPPESTQNPQNPPPPESIQSPSNPQQPSPTTAGTPPSNPSNPQQPGQTTGGAPQQPAQTTGGSPQQPAQTTPGSPEQPKPTTAVPSAQPILPIPLTPLPTSTGSSNPGIILPNGSTLLPGQETTISGHTISIPTAPPAPGVTVIGGTTTTLAGGSPTVVGGTTTTLAGGSPTVIGGTTTTLPDGSPTVIGGTTTLLPNGSPVVVVDGTTIPLTPPSSEATPAAVSIPVPNLLVTIANPSTTNVLTIAAPTTPGGGVLLPNGATLLPGSTTTYMGETLVLTTTSGPSGTTTVVWVVDATTTRVVGVPSASPALTSGFGAGTGYGGSALGTGTGTYAGATTTGAHPAEFTGGARSIRRWGMQEWIVVLGGAVVAML